VADEIFNLNLDYVVSCGGSYFYFSDFFIALLCGSFITFSVDI
jgi:hypothetical protein